MYNPHNVIGSQSSERIVLSEDVDANELSVDNFYRWKLHYSLMTALNKSVYSYEALT